MNEWKWDETSFFINIHAVLAYDVKGLTSFHVTVRRKVFKSNIKVDFCESISWRLSLKCLTIRIFPWMHRCTPSIFVSKFSWIRLLLLLFLLLLLHHTADVMQSLTPHLSITMLYHSISCNFTHFFIISSVCLFAHQIKTDLPFRLHLLTSHHIHLNIILERKEALSYKLHIWFCNHFAYSCFFLSSFWVLS
jgi:hypothetical protein